MAEARLRRNEARVERAIKAALARQKAKVLKALRTQHLTAAIPPDAFDIASWDTEVSDVVYPAVGNVFSDLTTGVFDFLRLPPETRNQILGQIDVTARAESFTAKVTSVGQDVAGRVLDTLGEGINKGESIDDLTDRIDAAFDIGNRAAERIARTETHGAAEAVTYDSAQAISDAGFTLEKTWVATEDSRTRPSHADADGQTVGIDAPFTVGDAELDHPGDETGPPEETVNCRCSTTYDMVSDDDLPDTE